MTPFGYIVPM
uniref:Uncharacterized protein n=1 Tax=Anguilla anguilla TaxID=7936 RepID=A0A0E9R006_ANGAN